MAEDRRSSLLDSLNAQAAAPSRAERLAAQLRANLHRRKARARGAADRPPDADD